MAAAVRYPAVVRNGGASAENRKSMSAHVILIDIVALLLATLGFHMAFRQRLVRRLWRVLSGAAPSDPNAPARPDGEDPVHYALIIFGIMIMAFGTILFAFTTLYSLLTAP
jgi:hypothetical protein